MRAWHSVIPIAAGLLCFPFATQPLSSDSASPTEGAGSIYITHVTLIDTQSGREPRDQTVVISGARISEVKDSKGVKPPAGAKVVDATGKYLIPGLWDMHVHGTAFDSTLPLYIANGVTGVREMFGPPDANKFRADLTAKHLIAPHIYLGSPIVDGKPPVWPNSIAVETADEARKVVDEQKQRGADFIKVYSLLSRDAYFAIVDESRRQTIPVDGHVPNSVSVWEATAAKQRTIEHLFGMELACSSREKDLRPKFLAANPAKKEWDALLLEAWRSYSDERCKALFDELKKNRTWPVPTLAVRHSFGLLNDPQFTSDNRVRYFAGTFRDWLTGKYDLRMKESSASDFGVIRETFAAEERLTGNLFRAEVPMLAGTDAGNVFCFPGFGLHDELALLVESGVSPLGALQMATRNPAVFMNATDKYGSVTPGKIADLVLLDADPLQEIHNTTKIQEVFLDGKEFDRAALDLILKNAEQSAKTAAAESMASSQQIAAEFRGVWTLNVEKSDFGGRPKPKMGQLNWGEHGWTFALVTADGRLYADGIATDRGCTLIGGSPNYSCEVEVVTPRHVRFTLREGATVRRIGDIELLENGTTQTTHRLTPPEGAPYVEKTIWEKPAENDTATRGVQSPSQQTSEEAAVRKLSELQFHQGHNLACLAGAHETGDSKQGASVSLVKFDPGCIIPWHWHTPNENVMVVDGALLQEWKDHPSSVAKRGDFIHIPSHQVNQVTCVSDAPCMILLYSDGLWDMHFVDASGKEISVDEAVAAATKKRPK